MRRLWWCAVAFFGCGAEPRRQPRELSVAPKPPVEVRSTSSYVLTQGARAPLYQKGDERGFLIEGERVVVTRRGIERAQEATDSPIKFGLKAGPGFVFATMKRVYTAKDFLGPLTPVVEVPFNLSGISEAAGCVLLLGDDETALSRDLRTGGPCSLPPATIEIAEGDGWIAALSYFGEIHIRPSAQQSWRALRLPFQPDSLERRDGHIGVLGEFPGGRGAAPQPRGRAKGKRAVLRSDGSFDLFQGDDEQEPSVPGWRAKEAPLIRAVTKGAWLAPGQAIAFGEGDLAQIAIPSGDVGEILHGVYPPSATVEFVRTPRDLLLVGRDRDKSFVLSGLRRWGVPTTEITFARPVSFFAGSDGALAIAATCSGAERALHACVRDRAGDWHEVDFSATEAKEVIRWVPRADGSVVAIAVVDGELGDIDSRTMRFRAWRLGGASVPRTHVQNAQNGVDRLFGADDDGLSGASYGGQSIFISEDREARLSLFTFGTTGSFGPYALARDGGRIWQTTDRGRSWVETEGPPSNASPPSRNVEGCSEIGCRLGPYLRVGWDGAPPSKGERTVAKIPPALPTDLSEPILRCRLRGASQTKSVDRSLSPEELGFGAERVGPSGGKLGEEARVGFSRIDLESSSDPNGRAFFRWRTFEDKPLTGAFNFGYSPPFDGAVPVVRAAIPLHSLRLGGVVSPMVTQLAYVLPSSMDGGVDLAMHIESTVGLLRGGQIDVLPGLFAQGAETLRSAVRQRDKSVALLFSGDHTIVARSERGDVLFRTRAPLSTLERTTFATATDGALALLRIGSPDLPPSESVPSVLRKADGTVEIVPPWKTLTSATDPACKSAQFRAVTVGAAKWLGLDLDVGVGERAIYRLAWTRDRLCLEGAELELEEHEMNVDSGSLESVPSTFVLRLNGPTTFAARIAIGAGYEFQQPYMCEPAPQR